MNKWGKLDDLAPVSRLAIAGVAFALVFLFVIVGYAAAHALSPQKKKLNRDDVYYEIQNDAGDHGNYIETYHLPDGHGGTVYCIVYSDKIGDGGGAGLSCDWNHTQ